MTKELEALKTIGDLDYIDEYDCRDGSLKQHFNKEFKTIEKGLKALEVIDNKFVNTALVHACKTVEEYNNELIWTYGENAAKPYMLTPEEFDLLKRC